MKAEVIVAKFAELLAEFEPIVGRPSADDLTRIREALLPLLLTIPYDEEGGVHSLEGIILARGSYIARYGEPFEVPDRVAAYDASIGDNEEGVSRARAEARHLAKKVDRMTYVTTVRETALFILAVVDETWYLGLKDPETFYTAVHPTDILAHLQATCGGTHAIDMVTLLQDMAKCHEEAPGVVEYINMLEDAQKKAKKAERTIDEKTIVDFATAAMETSGRYPRADEKWEDLALADQTWTAWKKIYIEASIRQGRKDAAAGGQPFGAAHVAEQRGQRGNGAFGRPVGASPADGAPPTHEELEGFFGDLANAATAENAKFAAALADLTTSVGTLTATNAELSASVKKLSGENRSLREENYSLRKKVGAADPRPRALVVERPARATRQQTSSALCPHCERVVRHWPEDCFELEENAHKRPPGWKSRKAGR